MLVKSYEFRERWIRSSICGYRLCQWEMELQHQQLTPLVLMGPSARHIETSTLLREIAGLRAPLRVTGAVNLHVYQPARC